MEGCVAEDLLRQATTMYISAQELASDTVAQRLAAEGAAQELSDSEAMKSMAAHKVQGIAAATIKAELSSAKALDDKLAAEDGAGKLAAQKSTREAAVEKALNKLQACKMMVEASEKHEKKCVEAVRSAMEDEATKKYRAEKTTRLVASKMAFYREANNAQRSYAAMLVHAIEEVSISENYANKLFTSKDERQAARVRRHLRREKFTELRGGMQAAQAWFHFWNQWGIPANPKQLHMKRETPKHDIRAFL